jgi:hypothetical protein
MNATEPAVSVEIVKLLVAVALVNLPLVAKRFVEVLLVITPRPAKKLEVVAFDEEALVEKKLVLVPLTILVLVTLKLVVVAFCAKKLEVVALVDEALVVKKFVEVALVMTDDVAKTFCE